jgi:hypothetical protein
MLRGGIYYFGYFIRTSFEIFLLFVPSPVISLSGMRPATQFEATLAREI